MCVILGVDLATHTGLAVLTAHDACTWVLDCTDPTGVGRFVRFREGITATLTERQPACVWYERVDGHRGTAAAHIYGALEALLLLACHDAGVPLHPVPVKTIKLWATGKGNATKAQMIAAALTRGWQPTSTSDDNDADAYLIACYGRDAVQAESDHHDPVVIVSTPDCACTSEESATTGRAASRRVSRRRHRA